MVAIGVVMDGTLDASGRTVGPAIQTRGLELIKREILALTREDFDVRFPPDRVVEARWSVEAIEPAIRQLLNDPGVDMVLTMGVFSTHVACRMRDLPKPVIAPWGVEARVQELPREGEGSGVRNLAYLTLPTNFVHDLQVFRELVNFERIHVLHDELTPQVIQEMYPRVIALGREAGFEAIPAPAGSDPEEALASLPPDTEAVYLVPLLRMTQEDLQRVIDGLRERKIPTFSIMGREDVERGILATSTPPTNLERVARRVALSVHRILLGDPPSTVPVTLEGERRLAINMETARAIGWYPDWRTALEAELINLEESDPGRPLSLSGAVEEAVAANLGLASRRRAVEAESQAIPRARSALLPQVDLSATALRIDEDRAEASLGSQPERSATGSVELRQALWSERLHTGLEIQRSLQESREEDLEALRLDTALAASSAYLELRRAETLQRIQTSNLQLTESNLRLARRRREVGVAGPAEVYRWESELAGDKAAVLRAYSARLSVQTRLNRILHRPLEEKIRPVDIALEAGGLLGPGSDLHRYVSNEASFRVFREFIVAEGLAAAPELRSLDRAIAAQERELVSARRAYWSPDIFLTGSISERLWEEGEGTEPPSLPSPFTAGIFPEADDTEWSVAMTLGIPLFTSGARPAEVRRTSESLARLRLEKEAAAERVEERLRVAVFATVETWPNIELSKEAADASKKNLALVTDMYASGSVSIIDLLDAQSAALVAEEVAANAVFDFLLDLAEIMRASSNFRFFISPVERDEWFHRLESFVARWDGEDAPRGGES